MYANIYLYIWYKYVLKFHVYFPMNQYLRESFPCVKRAAQDREALEEEIQELRGELTQVTWTC